MDTPLSVLLKEKGSKIYSTTPAETVYDCATKMNELKIGALLVLEGDALEGIISERDIICKSVCHKSDMMSQKVNEVMTQKNDLITVPPTMTVVEAMRLVTEKRFRHLPVVEESELLGLISIGDLTKWVMIQQENEIAALTGYIHGDNR